MKVSFYTSWNNKCGIADYSRSLVQALEKKGVSVEIVPVTDDKKTVHFIDDCKKLNNAHVAHIQYEYSFSSNSRIPFIPSLMSLWHFCILLTQIKIPIIIDVHELMTGTGQNLFMRFLVNFYTKIFTLLLTKFDHIIVHTERYREILARNGIRAERVTVFPIPVPIPQLPLTDFSEEVRTFKRALSIEGRHILTIFGFVNTRKGYEVAMPAIKELNTCTLLIAGGPQPGDRSGYFESLIATIKELHMEDTVKILGFLPESEIHKVMLSTDIFLAPFLDASGSASLTRIAAYQKPIIASDIPTMKELKERGLGIELFTPGDSRDLRLTIQRLLGSEENRHSLTALTVQFINKYTYDNYADVIKSLYEQRARI